MLTLLIGCWTLVVILSIIWRINQETYSKFHQAREIARSHLEKDLIVTRLEYNTWLRLCTSNSPIISPTTS